MEHKKLLEEIENRILKNSPGMDMGHDIFHIQRVMGNARYLQRFEGGDRLTIELAVLLHDFVDDKYFESQASFRLIDEWFNDLQIADPMAAQVKQIIGELSFSHELKGAQHDSIEFRIVQDADRLDAIGAVGIARAFSYGNQHHRPFFDPAVLPVPVTHKEQYRNSQSPTINHFFDKLLKIKGMMKTNTGKDMAEVRHRLMITYLNQFIDEALIGDETKQHWIELISKYDKI